MLPVTIPEQEFYNEATDEIITIKEQHLQLEHSLVSISKWESKWHKPFLTADNKSKEETIDYIRCMTLTQNVNPMVYEYIPYDIFNKINAYIEDPMTATWFSEDNSKGHSREIITSELIYYWMIALNIPVEFQKWHLNRLLTLIRVCNIKNTPPKKMGKRELLNRNAALNAQRRAKMGTTG